MFLESPFLLSPLMVFRTFQLFEEQTLSGQRRNGLSKNTLLDNRLFRTTPSPLLWRAPNSMLRIYQGDQESQGKEGRFEPTQISDSSEKLEKAGTVDFKKHPARKVGTRSRAVWTQGSRQVCLSRCLKS